MWAALAPLLACAVCPACLSVYAKVFATVGMATLVIGGILEQRAVRRLRAANPLGPIKLTG